MPAVVFTRLLVVDKSVSVILTATSMETAVVMCLMWKIVFVSVGYTVQCVCDATRVYFYSRGV